MKHVSNVVFQSTCKTCEADYAGETCRNIEVTGLEHEDRNDISEPARHSAQNKDNQFSLETITSVTHWKTIKFLKAIYSANLKSSLNKQI